MEKSISELTMEGIYQRAVESSDGSFDSPNTEGVWAKISKPYDAYWIRAWEAGLFETSEMEVALEKIREARNDIAKIFNWYEGGLINADELLGDMIGMKHKIMNLKWLKNFHYRYAPFVLYQDDFENRLVEECADYVLMATCIASN